MPSLRYVLNRAPVWSDAEIEDVIAFLRTLTDRDALPAGAAP